jgi:hypothetical protein
VWVVPAPLCSAVLSIAESVLYCVGAFKVACIKLKKTRRDETKREGKGPREGSNYVNQIRSGKVRSWILQLKRSNGSSE